jgi:hypothetical protein
VGVGTSLPSVDLHVSSTFPQIRLEDSDSAGYYSNIEQGNSAFTFDVDSGNVGSGSFRVKMGGSEAMRIDNSGRFLVGKASSDATTEGFEVRPEGLIIGTIDGNYALQLRRLTSDGDIVQFRKDSTTVGSIGSTTGGGIYIQSQEADTSATAASLVSIRDSTGGDRVILGGTSVYGFIGDRSGAGAGISFVSTSIRPFSTDDMGSKDNFFDIGTATARWNDAYITNGVTTGSDGNDKQDIRDLTEAEQRVAVACKGLLKAWRWKSAVEEKGDDARIHCGIIAQDLQAAFAAEGLDAGRYAMFMSNTWWETQTEVPAVEAVAEALDEEGNVVTEAVEAKDAYTRTDTYETQEEAPEGATERTRLGVRYSELLAFIIGAL